MTGGHAQGGRAGTGSRGNPEVTGVKKHFTALLEWDLHVHIPLSKHKLFTLLNRYILFKFSLNEVDF